MLRRGAVGAALVLLAACATGRAIRSGEAAADRGDWDSAVAYYRDALSRDPNRLDVKVALQRAMRNAADAHMKRARDLEAQDQLPGAAAEYKLAADFDPSYSLAQSKATELEQRIRAQVEQSRPRPQIDTLRQQAAQSPTVPRLDPRTRIPVLSLRNAAVRDILTFIGNATGINITYDQNLQQQLNQPYSIDLTDAPLQDALNQVLSANTLTFKVLNPKTIFVYADTPQMHQKWDDQYEQTFYIQNADAIADIVQILNQMLQSGPAVRPIIAQNKTANTIVVKATAPVLQVIESIINANDKPRAEVVIDVEILEVDRTRLKQQGLDLSQYALGFTFSPELSPPNTSPTTEFPLQPPPFNLNTLSKGVSPADFFVTAPTALIRLLESDERTRLLARPQLRGREGTPLTLNLGSDVPVPQTTFQSQAAGGIANVPTTSFTQRRVGVNLSITAQVTYQDEIILSPITVERSAQGPDIIIAGQSLPTFTDRTATVYMRLRDGESNMLAGLLREDTDNTQKSLPGIARIPILRSIFGNQNNTSDQSDIVMIVTPHIIRGHELSAKDLQPTYIGTGANFGAGGPPPLISPEAPPPPAVAPPAAGAPTTPPAGAAAAQPPPPPATPPTAPRAVPVVPIEPVAGQPAQEGQVTITPPGADLRVGGGPYTVPITVSGVSQMGSVTLSVSYNPAVLTVTAVTQGTFLQQGGVATTFVPKIDAVAGRVDIAITRAGDAAAGASGSGLLAAIAFQPVATGPSPLGLSGAALGSNGQPISLRMTPATVTVK